MPTLVDTKERLALNQSSREPTLEVLSGEKLIFWQGLSATVECALFSDTPEATSLVDISNLRSANIIVRKNGPTGPILFTQEITSFTQINYSNWINGTARHFAFAISELDTIQVVPASGSLPIYFVVTAVTQASVPYIAGFGFGEIIDVGFVENPLSSDYVNGRTPIVGGRLLTAFDANNFPIVNLPLSGPAFIETGETALTIGVLDYTIPFLFEKVSATYVFTEKYVTDTSVAPQDLRVIINPNDRTTTSFKIKLSAAPNTANCRLVWGVAILDPNRASQPGTTGPFYSLVPSQGTLASWILKDAGGRVFDVTAPRFGAVGDGVTDDTTAIQSAISAAHAVGGGTVYIPAGFFLVTNLYCPYSGVSICGAGKHSTNLYGTLASSYVLKLGTQEGEKFNGVVSNLRVTRVAGTVTTNSIGVSLLSFSDALFENVIIDRHGVGLKTSDGWISYDVGLMLSRIQVFDCIIHCQFKDIAEILMADSRFGRNGGDSIQPDTIIQFEGITNGVQISKSELVISLYDESGNLLTSPATGFLWTNMGSSASGEYFVLNDINIENITTGFKTSSTCQRLTNLNVSGSRLTPNGKLVDFHANTAVSNVSFSHNRSVTSLTACTFTNFVSSNFDHNVMGGTMTFVGGSWIVDHNFLSSDIYFSGTFAGLVIDGNLTRFNGSVPVKIDISAATGNVKHDLNVADFSDVAHPQPVRYTSDVPYRILNLDLTTVGPDREVFVAPRDFIIDKAYAVLTQVVGYSSAGLPQIVLYTGPGSQYNAVGIADANWNQQDRVMTIKPAEGGLYKIVKAGQTLTAINSVANGSTALKATVFIFGAFVNVT